MYLILLLLRTAIGMLTGVLVWLLLVWLAPQAGPLLAVVVGGLAGGAVCMSLGPSLGQQLALTAGLIMTLVAFFAIWEARFPHNWVLNYWPAWILPAYMAGAAIWLLTARALQGRSGGKP